MSYSFTCSYRMMVRLVVTLGTGVYDVFYERVDGLMADNGSFLID